MILAGVFVFLHLLMFGVTVFVASVAEDRDVIDDKDFAIIIGIFIPVGVLVLIGALWLADMFNNK